MTKSSGEVIGEVTSNILAYTFKIIFDIQISVSNYCNIELAQIIRSGIIMSLIDSVIIVLAAVDLNSKPSAGNIKIDNVSADLPLSFDGYRQIS